MRKQNLCAVAIGRTMDELIRQALLVENEVNLVEMRIDFLESQNNIDLRALKKEIKKIVSSRAGEKMRGANGWEAKAVVLHFFRKHSD